MKLSSKNQSFDEDGVVQQERGVLLTEQVTKSVPRAASDSSQEVDDSISSLSSRVRETMRPLPLFLQPLLTWLTGKPLRKQQPLWKRSAYWSLTMALLQLFGGVAASIVLMNAFLLWWPLLVLSWMVTVGGARILQVTIIHHCIHYNFPGRRTSVRWLVEVLSALLLIQDFASYQFEHVSIHHSKKLATLDDPDLKFLLLLGFHPGMSREALWKRLGQTVLSPRFHVLFLLARLTTNFKSPALYRKCLAIAFSGIVLGLVALTHAWLAWLIAWVFPLTVLYHIAALLQFTSEHRWLRVHDPDQPAKIVLARLTVGRFMGEAVPPSDLPLMHEVVAWGCWLARMLLIHLPFRVFVMPSDLPQHDWHHRHPSSKDWPNGAYARQRDLEEGCPGWPEPYTEVWGLLPAIDAVFQLLSSLPPLAETPGQMPLAERVEVLNGM
jgi:hypothetical protein